MRKLRAMAAGDSAEPLVPEEVFDDDSGELFSIQMCPSQYGAASNVKLENMRRLLEAGSRKSGATPLRPMEMMGLHLPLAFVERTSEIKIKFISEI